MLLFLAKDDSLGKVVRFTALVQVMDIRSEALKLGYTPMVCVRQGKSACKLAKINWRIGKETAKQKIVFDETSPPDSIGLKPHDSAEVVFEPQQALFVEDFKKCDGLGRIAVLESNACCMLGRVVNVEYAPK